jgi:hypothetical protein
MALTACAECSEQISDQAAACPKCGAPTAAGKKRGPAAKVLLWLGLLLVGGFALIMIIGSMLPETERSRARMACDNIKRQSYTAAEKARAEDLCAMLMREADRKMGRTP